MILCDLKLTVVFHQKLKLRMFHVAHEYNILGVNVGPTLKFRCDIVDNRTMISLTLLQR